MVREKWKGLAIQAGNSDDGAEASAGLDIESNDLIPSDTVEVTVRTKAYAAGLRNSANPFGKKTRTRRPSVKSYSRTLVMASGASNGRSLLTRMSSFGAIVRSRGLNFGILEEAGPPGAIVRSECDDTVVAVFLRADA